jgi:ABC-type glycerol-3-phosphate transport system permease component
MVPVATALMISLLPLEASRRGWWHFDIGELTLDNFSRAWNAGLSSQVANSFVITIGAVALTVAAGVLASYAFARLQFRGKRIAYFLLITTMIVPIQIILIPLLPWFQTLGLNEGRLQFVGIVLVHTAFGAGWAVFMLSTFFADIPQELLDAARVDGAGHLAIFRRIVLPLALPGIVSFAIIDFVFVWNDLLLALTLLGKDYRPITVGLANLQSPHLAQQDIVAAGSILAILPPLVVFALLNRYYVRGLFAGGVKG